ncbi:MAG: lamin tail domain-containing protein, partial [candidate division Zixibacteria bacterium]|nr:lamin tail domain-containing protein [candidate division Zixibacteria bacterium]
NTGGSVAIYRQDVMVSAMSWSEVGADGYSWERVTPSSQVVAQSVDFDGSTPGVVNSVTPVGVDLGLEGVDAAIENGWTRLEFTVVNRGLDSFRETLLLLYYDAAWHETTGQPIASFAVPSLEPGQWFEIGDHFQFDSMYAHLMAVLPDDDRLRNNKRNFAAPAVEFPAFHLTELAPRPDGSSDAEWIEIVNRSDRPYDLAGWQVGDYKRINTTVDTSLIVASGQRVVLVRSASLFVDSYPGFAGLMVEPSSWSLLNDGADTVLLVDHFGLEADRFGYSRLFDGDYTWSRDEQDGQQGRWGRSAELGGSPGQVNEVVSSYVGGDLKVLVTPEVFSPDGDGVEDSVVIIIDGPDTQGYVLKVFDRQGRVVRRFDQGGYRLDQYVWYGRSDAGRRLPVGIYVLYCRIDDAGSVKKPIVIAR